MNEQLSSRETIWLDIPATLKYLNVIRNGIAATMEHVPDLDQPKTSIYNVQLATHEICTNIALHAYPPHSVKVGRIQVSLTLDLQEKFLRIELFDDGIPFDIAEFAEPVINEGQVHGYGLFLVHNLMDTVTYRRVQNRNCWSLTKKL